MAGVGSAGIFAGSFIIIAFSVPNERRARYLGLVSSMYGVASVCGPLMGGAFTDHLTWRWCFYINLPLGAVVLAGIFFFFRPPPQNAALMKLPRKQRLAKLDGLGAGILIGSLSCLFIGLQWGGSRYAWHNARIVALLVGFGVGSIAWVAVEARKGENATVPARIIRQRSILFGALSAFCMGGAFFILLYYVAIWFQAVKGTTAVHSGLSSLPMILGLMSGMLLAGHTTNRVGYHAPFMIASAFLCSIGAGLLLTWTPRTGPARWIGYQALFGVGQGLGWQQPLLIAQTLLANKDIPTGTALMSGAKLLGGAIFVSAASCIFNADLRRHIARTAPALDPDAVVHAGATQLRAVIPPDSLPAVVAAYNAALRHVYTVSVAVSCVALIAALGVKWTPIHANKGGGTAAAPVQKKRKNVMSLPRLARPRKWFRRLD